MKNRRSRMGSSKGFTLTEIIVVIALVAIMVGIATPSMVQWWTNLSYRETATTIYTLLKEAKNRTIAENRQYRLEFTPTASPTQYRMTRGNQSYASTVWGAPLPPNFITIPTSVTLVTMNTTMVGDVGILPAVPVVTVSFNPNGTANLNFINGTFTTIQFQDNTGTARYTIQVNDTGRIQMRTGP